jgi:hypothetical protein
MPIPLKETTMRTRYLLVPLAMALASGVAAAPLMRAQAAVEVTVNVAPPPLPVYEQPPLPGSGYMWTPGYWAYDPADGYYWVPGTWVEPPEVGLLWTPGYWGWENGDYVWNTGYWGPTVGFYGGVDYGFGYNGNGFYGGRWDHGHFAYNTAVWNTRGVHVVNSYREAVARQAHANRVSFNGGQGGVTARPTAAQEQATHAHHVQATAVQMRQESAARQDPRLRASANHGKPPVAATARAGDFKAHTVSATGAGGPMPAQTGPKAAAPNAAHPAARNAAHPGVNPAERNAAKPNAHPAKRNAASPSETRPAQRNAATPNAMHPQAQGVTPKGTHPEARGPARPAAHPEAKRAQPQHQTEARPVTHAPAARAALPEAHHQVAAQPREAPRAAPHPMAHPAAALHPMARPAPHPAAHPAAPAREEKKQP